MTVVERRFLSAADARRAALERALYGGPAAGWATGAAVLAAIYSGMTRFRSAVAHAAAATLGPPVVSVGGLGLGGSGKTPLVRLVGRWLVEAGLKPAVLTRGYGWVRAADDPLVVTPRDLPALEPARVPDEALLFLRDGLPVGAHPRRARAAEAVVRAGLRPDAYLLDDGFQHRQLHRDRDLVLLSLRELHARRRTLPGGPFREPWSALERADRISITGVDGGEAASLALRSNADLGLPPGEPPLLAGLRWAGAQELGAWHRDTRDGPGAGRERAPHEVGEQGASCETGGGEVLAFSGVADPASFERLLAARGLVVTAHVVFPDHHRYRRSELARLLEMRPRGGALVTTEKDAARLPPGSFPRGACSVVAARLHLWRGEEELRADLQRLASGDV